MLEPVIQRSAVLVHPQPYDVDICKCIKFATTTSPLPFNLWIQIVPTTETECKMKLTIGMDINPFMKTMVQKPLQEGLEKMADMLAMIQY